MAEAVFFIHGEFCHGLSPFSQEKNWIIAKSASSAFFGDDLAFAESLCEVCFAVWNCDGNRGVEARDPRARFGLQLLQEIFAPFRIR